MYVWVYLNTCLKYLNNLHFVPGLLPELIKLLSHKNPWAHTNTTDPWETKNELQVYSGYGEAVCT